MRHVRRVAAHLLGGLLETLLPADCPICARPLPWRQDGGVCLPCWRRLPWTPGYRPRRGVLQALLWAADYEGEIRHLVHHLKFGDMDYLARPLGRVMAGAPRPPAPPRRGAPRPPAPPLPPRRGGRGQAP